MAKYGKNNYFDGVVLPEPKEEALRRMAKGVKMGYNQYVDKSASTMFKSPSMPIGANDFTLEYFGNLYGAISSNTPLIFNANAPYAYSKGCLLIYGTSQIAVRWIIFEKPSSGDLLLDSIDLIAGAQESILHLALTRKGTTVKVYINGELKATKKQSAVKDLGDFRLGMANSSNMVMSRIYNYAMAADEVKDLYNDGDPAGYKLPSNYKGYGDVYHSDFSEGADDWHVALTDYVTMTVADGVITISKEDERRNMNIARKHNPYASRVVNCFVRLEFAEPLPSEVGNIAARPFNSIVGVNLEISSDRLSASGTLISTIAKPNGGSMIIFQGSGAISISISSISFTPAVCIAEYLPQNLIPTAEGSVVQWLDSAPQLPEANGILPPLDASVGGYDLAAIGNPKIII